MALTTTAQLPLTTVFTPPAGCLETYTYNEHAIWAPDVTRKSALSPAVLLGATGQAPDLLCYPPKYTQKNLHSPGICPSGWSNACTPSVFGSIPPTGPATTVQCCPSGLTCSGDAWCRGSPPPTDVPMWSVYTDKWGMEGVMTTTRYGDLSVLAKPIFVAYQSSDSAVLQAARLAAQAGPQPTTQSVNSNSTSPSSDSLSGGAIAGIAVGSAMAGIILATVITFFALRFCLGYRKMSKDAPYGYLEGEEKRKGTASHASEMDAHNRQIDELQGQQRYELAVPLKELDRMPELEQQK